MSKTSTTWLPSNEFERIRFWGDCKEDEQNWIGWSERVVVTWIDCLALIFASKKKILEDKAKCTGKATEYRVRNLKDKKHLEYAAEPKYLLDLRLVSTPPFHCTPANYNGLHIATLQYNHSPWKVSRMAYGFAKIYLSKLFLPWVQICFRNVADSCGHLRTF